MGLQKRAKMYRKEYFLNVKISVLICQGKRTFKTRGQSYKTFITLGQIYKLVLKLDNVLWFRKYLVRILGHYTLKYWQSNFFDRGTISNLGTLFYTNQRLKLFYRIGPWSIRCNASTLLVYKLEWLCATNKLKKQPSKGFNIKQDRYGPVSRLL